MHTKSDQETQLSQLRAALLWNRIAIVEFPEIELVVWVVEWIGHDEECVIDCVCAKMFDVV